MTTAAWIMMGASWGIIGFFTVRFFTRVVRSDGRLAAEDEAGATDAERRGGPAPPG